VILHDLMSHPVAASCLRQQIGRVRHALHAARNDDAGTARDEQIVAEHRRLHRGAAHLVDGRAADGERQSCLQHRLPRRRLPLTGRQDVAHDRFVDVGGPDARALDGRLDRDGTQFACSQRCEVALEAAHRRARGADDDDRIVQHKSLLESRPRSGATRRLPQRGRAP